jgi:hypothetical protein
MTTMAKLRTTSAAVVDRLAEVVSDGLARREAVAALAREVAAADQTEAELRARVEACRKAVEEDAYHRKLAALRAAEAELYAAQQAAMYSEGRSRLKLARAIPNDMGEKVERVRLALQRRLYGMLAVDHSGSDPVRMAAAQSRIGALTRALQEWGETVLQAIDPLAMALQVKAEVAAHDGAVED